MDQNHIVTIDGPVGSGKSTIGRLLAKKLELVYLDTGAMYRVVALEAKNREIVPEDEESLGKLCREVKISFKHDPEGQRVFSGENDVSGEIRTPEISMLASKISALGAVRKELVHLQQQAGQNGRIVVDGRDAGTVIFPRALFKFFLDAGVEIRARRRYKELVEKNMKVDYTDIFQDIQKRDENDRSRSLSPLKPAPDAVIVDTSEMTIEEVVGRLSLEIDQKAASLP